jgi:hypothetical protein
MFAAASRRTLDELMAPARETPDDFPQYAPARFGMLLSRAGYDDLASEVPA